MTKEQKTRAVELAEAFTEIWRCPIEKDDLTSAFLTGYAAAVADHELKVFIPANFDMPELPPTTSGVITYGPNSTPLSSNSADVAAWKKLNLELLTEVFRLKLELSDLKAKSEATTK